jgi:glutamate/tyrosine decarboxylase-like PLP-dependent enzyme
MKLEDAARLIERLRASDRIVSDDENWVRDLDLSAQRTDDEALAICERILSAGVATSHRRAFGWFTPTTLPSAAIADLIVSAVNPQLAVRAVSPSAVAAEERLIGELCRFFGLPSKAGGTFTAGGSEANLSALIVALHDRIENYAEDGLIGKARPMLYVSAEAHRSFEKVARAVGLGRASLRIVPTKDDLSMDVAALEAMIAHDGERHFPWMVVATAGTTNVGAIDDMRAIADTCAREHIWMHVDAAWGGAAVLSPRLRPLLAGIEHADSITFDPHKGLSLPLGTGAFFVRDAALLSRAFRVSASYVLADGPPDPYCASLAWSRRFAGLRLLLPLLIEGWPAFARRFERQIDLANALRHRLVRAGWEILSASELGIVCFADPKGRSPRAIASDLEARGRAWLVATEVKGRPALRACVTSRDTDEVDLAVLIDELDRARREVLHATG